MSRAWNRVRRWPLRNALVLSLLGVLVSGLATASLRNAEAVSSADTSAFKRLYPRIEAVGFEPSPIAGLIEVRTADALFYFAPSSGLLVFGEIFNPAGVSLTGERRVALKQPDSAEPSAHPSAASKSLAGNGLLISKGLVPITAYLDAECGHCANAVEFFIAKKGLPLAALNVVFVSHTERGLRAAEHVLCAPEHLRARALQQVFARGGEIDWLRCEKGQVEARTHARIAADLGVSATPVFAVQDQVVLGFNQPRLESLVDQSGNSSRSIK